jgi:putative DNA primase/helicase
VNEPTRTTDAGNAKRLVDRRRGQILYCAAMGKWLRYDGKRWRWDDDGYVVRCAKKSVDEMFAEAIQADDRDRAALVKHAIYSESEKGIRSAMKLAECELPVNPDKLDADDFAFAVENGVVDLRTGKPRPHSPNDLITRISPVVFDSAATCPLWTKFLDRIMATNDDLIGYIQRIAGLCLTGANSIQELWIFYGGGANGKSVFVDTLSYILADFAGVAPESLLIVRRGSPEHPTEVAGLHRKRLVVASETEDGGKLRLQLVKKMTGDEKLTGRYMRQDYFEFRRTHKLILVTNHRPQISESTEAAWRRIRLIPFAVTIPPADRDPNLLAKLKAEAPGILNWMIAGCLDWQKNGMQPPTEVLAATEEYQADADPLGDFLSDRCMVGEAVRVSRAELWANYQQWAKLTGECDGMDRSAFYERVRRMDGIEESAWKISGNAVRGFLGIGLVATMAAGYEGES